MKWYWIAGYFGLMVLTTCLAMYDLTGSKRKKRLDAELNMNDVLVGMGLGVGWPFTLLFIGFIHLSRGVEKLWVYRHRAEIVANTLAKNDQGKAQANPSYKPTHYPPQVPYPQTPYYPQPTLPGTWTSGSSNPPTTTGHAP